MLKIMDVNEGWATILLRKAQGEEIPDALRAGLGRVFGEGFFFTPQEGVRRILHDIRLNGDVALRHWAEKSDGLGLDSFASPHENGGGVLRLPADFELAACCAERIALFTRANRCPLGQLPSWADAGQTVTPLSRVGVYVPGGTAPLPSSLLMSPSLRVAGGKEVVVMLRPDGMGRVPGCDTGWRRTWPA